MDDDKLKTQKLLTDINRKLTGLRLQADNIQNVIGGKLLDLEWMIYEIHDILNKKISTLEDELKMFNNATNTLNELPAYRGIYEDRPTCLKVNEAINEIKAFKVKLFLLTQIADIMDEIEDYHDEPDDDNDVF